MARSPSAAKLPPNRALLDPAPAPHQGTTLATLTLTLALTLALALTRYHAFQDERNLYMLLEYIIGGERLGLDPNPNPNPDPNPDPALALALAQP